MGLHGGGHEVHARQQGFVVLLVAQSRQHRGNEGVAILQREGLVLSLVANHDLQMRRLFRKQNVDAVDPLLPGLPHRPLLKEPVHRGPVPQVHPRFEVFRDSLKGLDHEIFFETLPYFPDIPAGFSLGRFGKKCAIVAQPAEFSPGEGGAEQQGNNAQQGAGQGRGEHGMFSVE
jgi:hypothetical protein